MHILLADDDDDDKELFQAAVEATSADLQFSTVANGKELIDLLKATESPELPDLILLDLNMPIKGGQECLTEIRADQRLSRLPVIIYSTSRGADQIEEMYHKGADYYIRKPSSFNELRAMVKTISSMAWDMHTKPDKDEFILFQYKPV